jgi:ubiquinone/menaquinone biosynthesis C-methylase UbiE
MNSIKERIAAAIVSDLRSQFRCPPKSFTANILTKKWSAETKPLVKTVIEKLNVKPDHNILEIGYGRGNGFPYLFEKFKDGKGWVFGLECSPYMEEVVRKKYAVEIQEDGILFLDHIENIANLPYPNNTFNGIYHVDVFYFWQLDGMKQIVQEFLRILKPGGSLICGLEMERLKKLEKRKVLQEAEYNPMRYVQYLDPAGFKDVSITYEKPTPSSSREFILISATKPSLTEDDLDPDKKMEKLELMIKEKLALESLVKSKNAMSRSMKEKLENAKGL